MVTIFEKLDRYFRSNWRLAVLDPDKGRWLIEPRPSIIAYLKAENAHGRHILIQPKDPATYLLADDITSAVLCAHHKRPNGCFKPGRMVVETSPQNFQVWIHCRSPLGLERKRMILKKLRSDPGADPNNRFGRCPGFRNRKKKYLALYGFFPLARLIWVDWNHRAVIPEGYCMASENRSRSLSHQPPLGGVCQTCSRNHFYKGDESQTDFAFALSLMRRGFSDECIRSYIQEERVDWAHHRGRKRQMDYLDRTIRSARRIAGNSANQSSLG